MSYTSYLINEFDNGHENIYFRKFSDALSNAFQEEEGEHILIGNISVLGKALDAVYISSGKIIVIDFKDYGGDLTFSENNPWILKTTKGDELFVQGGARMRNPFQQVKAYRWSLLSLLKQRLGEVLKDQGHLNLGHISSLINFHQKVNILDPGVPSEIARYFHITDNSNVVNRLSDIHSPKLVLNDNEIRKIASLLDVREDNLLEKYSFDDSKNLKKYDERRLSLIKRLTKNIPDDQEERLVSFYRTLVNVERFKEPESKNMFAIPLVWDANRHNIIIDVSKSEDFNPVFQENRLERFPKNLLVALEIKLGQRVIPLMQSIVMASDIKDTDGIQVSSDSFVLYEHALNEMGASEDLLEDLRVAVEEASKIEDKLLALKEILGVLPEISSNILVGLSTESMYSLQLYHELGNLMKPSYLSRAGKVFKSVLNNAKVASMSPETPIRLLMTELNGAQSDAVDLALNESLSLVTGPPGTGKTQVAVNIIANAIYHEKSVVFASKNNKAVDNVKERVDPLVEQEYVFRFGTKPEILERARPQIKRVAGLKVDKKIEDFELELEDMKDELDYEYSVISENQELLESIPILLQKLKAAEKSLAEKERLYARWKEEMEPHLRSFFVDSSSSISIDKSYINLLHDKVVKWKGSFFSRLAFNLFRKKQLLRDLAYINDKMSERIRVWVEDKNPYVKGGEPILITAREYLEVVEGLISRSFRIAEQKAKHIEEIGVCSREKERTEELYKERLGKKEEYIQFIRESFTSIKNLSGKAFTLSINQKIFDQDIEKVLKFHDSIPVKKMSRHDEDAFVQSAKGFLDSFKAVCLTSLSVRNSFPLEPELFDLLVIDEASQCDIASALPLIYRAKKVVVIGDPLQLKHITKVSKDEQEYLKERLNLTIPLDFVDSSLYDHCYTIAGSSGLKTVFLDEHYRCHPEIIGFSNEYFYPTIGQEMSIKTNVSGLRYGDKGMNWINVSGQMHTKRNINSAEANRCIDLLRRLTVEFPEASIGIITPFNHQYEEIFSLLPGDIKEDESKDVSVMTVHKSQGIEKDIVIFSPVLASGATRGKVWFLNNNAYLINVALTRAKSSLYIVGDHDFCKTRKNDIGLDTPLSQLAKYCDRLGKVL